MRGRGRNENTLRIMDKIKAIIEEHRRMTCRGVFYQLLSAGLIEKSEAAAGKVNGLLRELRWSGEISMDSIVDETRRVSPITHIDGRASTSIDGLALS